MPNFPKYFGEKPDKMKAHHSYPTIYLFLKDFMNGIVLLGS
jgi:hypothetical protein